MPFYSQASSRHAQHYMIAMQKVDQLYDAGGDSLLKGLRDFDQDWANISAGHAWAVRQFSTSKRVSRLCAD